MERVVIVGNCQATALELMLNTSDEFTRRFEFVSFPPVHEFPEERVPELHRAVTDADLLILQRIDDGYRDSMGLGTDTLAKIARTSNVLRWPSVYWAGYFPDLFYLRDAVGGLVLDGPSDYHDRTILRAYAAGVDVPGTCLLLEDPERPSAARAWAEEATAELSSRGRDCEVQVTEFIASRFREELLFYTMNHPTNRLLAFIAQQIIDLIGVLGNVDSQRMPGEVLGSTFYPLHANHVRALELSFGEELGAGRTPFRMRGTSYDAVRAVRAFYDYYEAHPQLVEFNLDPHVVL
jgi:hypothetical protein